MEFANSPSISSQESLLQANVYHATLLESLPGMALDLSRVQFACKVAKHET